ncbi:MAG: response regulator transcription factor [Acidobacteriota bacterium]
MKRKIRILITDDHTLFRECIHHMLDAVQDMEVIGEAANTREALNKVQELAPDVILMDIGMPGRSSIEAVQQIKKTHPNTKIIFLTMYDDQEYIIQCLKASADGYVLKDTPSSQLINGIREVTRGGQFISPLLLKKVMGDFLGDRKLTGLNPDYERLTTREREILKLLAEGNSIKEIAANLDISERTAAVHKTNLMRKLNIHSRTELVKFAIRNKLIRVGNGREPGLRKNG